MKRLLELYLDFLGESADGFMVSAFLIFVALFLSVVTPCAVWVGFLTGEVPFWEVIVAPLLFPAPLYAIHFGAFAVWLWMRPEPPEGA